MGSTGQMASLFRPLVAVYPVSSLSRSIAKDSQVGRLDLQSLEIFFAPFLRSFFVCRQIGDQDYLVADLQLLCYTETWNNWVAVAGIAVLIYPVGIPVFFFVVLYKNRYRLGKTAVKQSLGFLYEGAES
jgi:hypothetical protein